MEVIILGKFKGLAHIGIFTDNIEKSKGFYITNFGFKLGNETRLDKPDGSWLKLSFLILNDIVIELVEPSDKTVLKKGDKESNNHLAIKVENISEVVKELKEKGISSFETEEPIFIEKLFSGSKAIFLKGPAGERLELFEFLS